MTKKQLLLIPTAALACQLPLAAQEQTALNHAASKVDKDGEYYQLNKVDQDIDLLGKYFDLILKVARDNGEDIPANLDTRKILSVLGVDEIKALAQSSKSVDNAWLNKSYLETGNNNKGIFSLIGKQAEPFQVTQIAPAGTDLAFQVSLDLTQLEQAVMEIANLAGEKEEAKRSMNEPLPELGITASQLLKKLNVTVNLAIDLDDNQKFAMGPVQLGRPNLVMRLDGIAWAWAKLEKELLEKQGLPFQKKVEGEVITYTLPKELRPHFDGYSPCIIVNKTTNHIWISSDEAFLAKCQAKGNKLQDSAEFKATWEGLPAKGNSMFYISKSLINDAASIYKSVADQGILGEDFNKARPLMDELVKDLTKCKTGYAAVLSKQERGILCANKSPLPSWVGKAANAALPYLTFKIQKDKLQNKKQPRPIH